jgi:hypothetical protein
MTGEQLFEMYKTGIAPAAAKPALSGLKPTPNVNTKEVADSCVRYGATQKTCGCPDFANRKGSYAAIDGRTKACKHMLYMQTHNDIAI